MTLDQLRAEMADNSDLEKLDMVEELLRAQIHRAAECGLPVDLTLMAMFGLPFPWIGPAVPLRWRESNRNPDRKVDPHMNITLNGITFHYSLDGPEGAPWLVFSNSLTTDLGMWDGEVAKLQERYRILRYDTRGHGKTEASAPPYSFDLLVSDVIALMDALAIDKAHYVGLSLGGMTGLGVAIEHGDRLHSLAACDTRAYAEPAWAELWLGRMDVVRKAGVEALVEPTIERWFTDDFRKTSPEVLDKVRAMISTTAADGYIGCAQALQHLNYAPRLGEIRVPCLFMTGASDQSTPPDASRAMHEAVPGSTCVIVDPASHISNMENPEQFDSALFEHLERAEKS